MTSLILIVWLDFYLQDCSSAQKQLSQWRNGLWFWYHECCRQHHPDVTLEHLARPQYPKLRAVEIKKLNQWHHLWLSRVYCWELIFHTSISLPRCWPQLIIRHWDNICPLYNCCWEMVSSTCLTWWYFDGMEDEQQHCLLPPAHLLPPPL